MNKSYVPMIFAIPGNGQVSNDGVISVTDISDDNVIIRVGPPSEELEAFAMYFILKRSGDLQKFLSQFPVDN